MVGVVRGAMLVSLLSLAACQGSREVFLPDGSRGHQITCNGVGNTINTCHAIAGDLCASRGYEVINQTEYENPVTASTSTRSLLVRCRS